MLRVSIWPSGRLCLLLAALLSGCVQPSQHSPIVDELGAVSFEPPPVSPGTPPPPAASGGSSSQLPEPKLQAQIYPGRPVGPRPQAGAAQRSANGVQLDFDQAEIRDVIKVILGDTLKRSYTVDSDVQGQVTMSTSAPMAEGDLLAVLETVLRANGATLVESSPGAYRIMPVDSAIGRSEVLPLGGKPVQVRPGYGITIVPLRNISSTSAAQFIQPLVASPEDIRIDPGRNAILFSGTASERQNVVQTLEDLDVDWMAGKSIGLFPLQRANAEAILPELQAIFAPFDPTGAEPSLIRFVALARMNAVLSIGADTQQMREVEQWVSRLDHGQTVGSQFYVYYLKHAAAEEVAKLLNEAFSDSAASDTGPTLGSASAALGGVQAQQNEDGESPAPAGAGTPAATAAAPPSNGPVKVVASKANNSLLIRATPADYERVEATLARIDTAPWQVLIEATIAEVSLNDQLRYGVQYFLESGSFAGAFNSLGTATAFNALSAPLPGFNFLFTPGGSTIAIDALSRITNVKVLSSPSVVVQDNSEAVLTVGEEVPVQTQQQQSVTAGDSPIVNSIEYRDTGVILQVRPRINSNQAVSLEIAQEVSRVNQPTGTDFELAHPDLHATQDHQPRQHSERPDGRVGWPDPRERGERPRPYPRARRDSGAGRPVRDNQQQDHAHRADRVHHAAGDPQPGGRPRCQRGVALAPQLAPSRRLGVRCGGSLRAGTRSARAGCPAPGPGAPAPATGAQGLATEKARERWPTLTELTGPVLAGLLGLCLGSFVCTLALRASDDWRGIWWGRSQCPACRATLGPRDLIPVISWIWSRGRCRHCGAAISPYYPLVEISAAAIGAVALAWLSGPEAWLAALLGWWLLALALIDLETWLLPDPLTLPLIAAGLVASATGTAPGGSLSNAAAGAAAGYLSLAGIGYLYQRLRGRDGLGLGDAKLLAAAGAWLGLASLPWLVLTAALLGLVLALIRAGPLRAETAVPFGPPLALAFWAMFLLRA